MHKVYKADIANGVTRIKEFRLESGRRADFIDFEEGVIYELKPNNPRAVRDGAKQLRRDLDDARKELPGIDWKIKLDAY